MIHMRCPDCDRDMGCEDMIHVYNEIAYVDELGLTWCPLCLLKARDREDDYHDLLADLCCRECGGPARTHGLNDVAADANVRTRRMFSGDVYRSVVPMGPTVGAAYCDNVYTAWLLPTQPPVRGAVRAARGTITLPVGAKRCHCNNCERLVING